MIGDWVQLRPQYQLVVRDDHRLILYSKAGESVVVASKRLPVRELCELLRAGSDRDALVEWFGAELSAELDRLLGGLAAADALRGRPDTGGLSALELERFDRAVSYFAHGDSAEATAHDAMRSLRRARVLLLGVGSLGSWALSHLVASGVGSVVGLDMDRVESSNLSRQCLFGEGDIGEYKTRAAARAVAAQSRHTQFIGVDREIRSPVDVLDVIAEHGPFDLAVLTADMPMWQIKMWCADACSRAGVPMLRGNSQAVGPLMIPGQTACPGCEWPRVVESMPDAERLIAYYRDNPRARPQRAALSTIVARMGAHLAEQAITFLAGQRQPRTINARIVVQPGGYFAIEPFERHPDCPVCGVPVADTRGERAS